MVVVAFALLLVVLVVLVVEGVVVGAIFRCFRGGVGVSGGVVMLEEGVVEDGVKRITLMTARFYRFGARLRGEACGCRVLREDAVGDVALG